jgi:hypothetical protein
LKVKERKKKQTIHIEDTQRLVTEIEMLKIVLYLVSKAAAIAAAYMTSSYIQKR